MSFISLKEHRFGRWNMWVIVALHAICGYGFVVAGHWAGYVLCAAVILVLWIGGWINYRALKRIDNGHPNGHDVMLFDASPWVCMHGVKPHKITKLCAWPIGHDAGTPEPTEEQRRIRNYLKP